MKALCFVETSVNINHSTRRHIVEDTSLVYKTTSYREESGHLENEEEKDGSWETVT